MRWTPWAAGTAWGPRDRGPRAEAPMECYAPRAPERTARPERIRGGRARAGARGKPECSGNRFTRRSPLRSLSALCAFGAAQKGLRQRRFLEFPLLPAHPTFPARPWRRRTHPALRRGPARPTASECGPSASLDVNPDRPTQRAGPALCRGPVPSPASLSAWELPSPRTKPPACPSQGRGGRRGETNSHPSRSAYF